LNRGEVRPLIVHEEHGRRRRPVHLPIVENDYVRGLVDPDDRARHVLLGGDARDRQQNERACGESNTSNHQVPPSV
jgi:hypothetical protein